MANRRNDRSLTRGNCTTEGFVAKDHEIHEGTATASDDDDIDLWVGIECLNCRNDLRRGIVALPRAIAQSFGKAPAPAGAKGEP